jgi:carbon starvation protein
MNTLVIVLLVAGAFGWAYRFYARKLESLMHIDPKRATPAFAKYDSVDYIPAKNWLILFGHHFSSIAGAGPIIGPVIAVMLWGWFPALLWVIVGSIFIGGIHDFGALITSVREGGASIGDITQKVISRKAKIIFSLFLWVTLILILAVFAYLCADTFVKEPKIVFPSLGMIPVALMTGYLLYHARVNTALATVFGLVCLIGLIFLGEVFAIKGSLTMWLVILFVYSYFASILPVNILLQPRDYLSSFLLFFGVGVGYLGLCMVRPSLHMPAFHHWDSSEGYLWPALFVTVACGAVSGFHSLVASGTSSKQLANERHAKRIGYGGMLTEGVVAVLAIVCIAILFKRNDDFIGVLKTDGPIGLFGRGYGVITKSILFGYGSFIAITILNAFILTTLDTAARIARYLTEELFLIRNRYLSTLIIVLLSAALAFSGKWQKIWPVFGASNQLVASLALFVISCWLLAKHKPISFTLWPAFFMFLTTIASLVMQIKRYAMHKDMVLFSIAVVLMMLALFMGGEVIRVLRRKYV